jgi:type VI secretion system secreted protein VgrG
MPTFEQADRPLAVQTPAGKDKLVLLSFTGEEHLSRLFSFELRMLSDQESINPKQLVGKRVSFSVRKAGGDPRHFNGFINRFTYSGAGDRGHLYAARVVPWFWFLRRNSNCRIFQNKNVPDIVKQVFQDAGFTDFELKLSGNHPKREYCVQYRESDFDFVSRLLEEEGIFYFFDHSQDKHQLILADDTSGYKTSPEPNVQLLSKLSQPEITDQLSRWEHCYEFRAGKWSYTDYDFENPSTDLSTKTNSLVSVGDNSKYEFYDYPGEYKVKGDGESLVKLRMQEEEQEYDTVVGTGNSRSFSPGFKFTLEKHHVGGEAGKSYVLTSVHHEANLGGAYVTGAEHVNKIYENTFRCQPDSVVFRPPRISPRPEIHGIQTALVVGPQGEEIFTDKYGRVKCQFYWDREGKKDDKSSCWIRVATPWSGKNWGFVQIPRIGDEVIVSFLEGDPDQPLITGMVYNAERMPPWKLPDNKTQSGIMTCSTLKGEPQDDCNIIRFEDKKNEEQILIHAERNLDTIIENNETRKVGFDNKDSGDQTIEIYNDQNLKVGQGSKNGSQTVEIYKDRSVKLEMGNDALTIKMGNQTTKLDLGKSTTEAMQSIELKVGQNSIKIDQMGVTISGLMLKFEGQMMTQIKGLMTQVSGDAMLTVKGGITMIN